MEGRADVNACRANGATALFLAANHGHADTVRALAALGANLSLRCEGGHTPASAATAKGHSAVVLALVELDAAASGITANIEPVPADMSNIQSLTKNSNAAASLPLSLGHDLERSTDVELQRELPAPGRAGELQWQDKKRERSENSDEGLNVMGSKKKQGSVGASGARKVGDCTSDGSKEQTSESIKEQTGSGCVGDGEAGCRGMQQDSGSN